jgi:UDP-glucose 4-epimerase
MLLDAGQSVVTLDNLVNGPRDAVIGGKFVLSDLDDTALLGGLFRSHTFNFHYSRQVLL